MKVQRIEGLRCQNTLVIDLHNFTNGMTFLLHMEEDTVQETSWEDRTVVGAACSVALEQGRGSQRQVWVVVSPSCFSLLSWPSATLAHLFILLKVQSSLWSFEMMYPYYWKPSTWRKQHILLNINKFFPSIYTDFILMIRTAPWSCLLYIFHGWKPWNKLSLISKYLPIYITIYFLIN